MPDTMTAPPPAAVTHPVTPSIAPVAPPAPPPKPSDPKPPAVPTVSKKRSEQAGDDLKAFADKPETLKDRPSKKPEAQESPKADAPKEADAKPPVAGDKPTEAAPDDKAASPDGKKVNPWKVVDEWKGKYAALEKQLVEMKGKPIDPEKEKQFTERLTKAEQREKELVEELRFHNFEKYDDDFKKNYDAPYQAAWRDAVEEVTQLPATLDDGTVRAGTASDLSKLMDLPPVERRELAERMFGKFADDVLREVKEARRLHDARARALDEAKKGLSEKQKQRIEQSETARKTVNEQVGKIWQDANQSVLTHEKYGEFFKPIDGDQDGNQKLAKGFELADRAFSENPFNPTLKPDERAAIVKRHSAVRNRAAAFGRLVAWNSQAKTKIGELEKELAQYKLGDPGAGNGRAGGGAEPPMTAGQRAERGLEALAK